MAKKPPKIQPEKHLDRSLLEQFHKDIVKIILDYERRKGYDIKRDPSESKGSAGIYNTPFRWRGGSRSVVQSYTVESVHEGSEGIRGYASKIVPIAYANDAHAEISVPGVIKGVFPEFAGYKKAGGYYIIVNERPTAETLHERFNERTVITPRDLTHPIDQAFLLNRFKPGSKEVKSIEEKLAQLKDEFQEGEGKLDRLDLQRYILNMVLYSCHKKRVSNSIVERMEASFAELAEKYLVAEDLMCLIQHDGYPWNHLGNYLIDAGDVKIGSPAMQLGCLIGHPSVYDKLFVHSPPGAQTLEVSPEDLYDKKFNAVESIKKVAGHYALKNGIDKTRIENGIYVGAIYSNLRLTFGTPFENQKDWEEVRRLRRAAVEHLDILGEREEAARKFKKAFMEVGWPI